MGLSQIKVNSQNQSWPGNCLIVVLACKRLEVEEEMSAGKSSGHDSTQTDDCRMRAPHWHGGDHIAAHDEVAGMTIGSLVPTAGQLVPNPEQRAVIEAAADEWLLVVAGPGTGKTQVAAARLLHLLSGGLQPAQILVLSFSRSAVATLTNRIARVEVANERLVEDLRHLAIRTFDSWAFRMLRQGGGAPRDLLARSHDENIVAVSSALTDEADQSLLSFLGVSSSASRGSANLGGLIPFISHLHWSSGASRRLRRSWSVGRGSAPYRRRAGQARADPGLATDLRCGGGPPPATRRT